MATHISSSAASGTSIFTIVYGGIILGKIFGLIDWSWFYIFLPIIIIVMFLALLFVVGFVLPYIYSKLKRSKTKRK